MKNKTQKVKSIKFPSKVILAEGYPWAMGCGPEYTEICMQEAVMVGKRLPLDWPQILWSKNLPKYRLVLEKI